MAEQFSNIFDTKARVVMVFDPDHMKKLDRDVIMRVIDATVELIDIPGFRGCLPCAASGLDEVPWNSRVLPAVLDQNFRQ